jgi:hypothetical protein
MPPMPLARLALLVVVYLSLDVANPMMPGALVFGLEDSVEVRAARVQDHDATARLAVAPVPPRVPPIEPVVTRRQAGGSTGPQVRPAPVKRAQPSRTASSPTSPDD